MEERSNKLFYTPEEFRQILGCSRHLCYESLRQKRIRSFRLGKRIFIPASEVGRLGQSATAENDYPQELDSELW